MYCLSCCRCAQGCAGWATEPKLWASAPFRMPCRAHCFTPVFCYRLEPSRHVRWSRCPHTCSDFSANTESIVSRMTPAFYCRLWWTRTAGRCGAWQRAPTGNSWRPGARMAVCASLTSQTGASTMPARSRNSLPASSRSRGMREGRCWSRGRLTVRSTSGACALVCTPPLPQNKQRSSRHSPWGRAHFPASEAALGGFPLRAIAHFLV